MAKDDRVTLRKQDGSGAGVILKRADVKRFLDGNQGYAEEAPEETKANQAAADEQVKAQAQAQTENKAVTTAENKRA